jgi:hypothetical protein
MADHADHKLTHHTLRRTELGSVDADFLYRIGAAPSFLRAFLNSRGEDNLDTISPCDLGARRPTSTTCKACASFPGGQEQRNFGPIGPPMGL